MYHNLLLFTSNKEGKAENHLHFSLFIFLIFFLLGLQLLFQNCECLAQKIFDERLSVREVEKLVKVLTKPIKEKKETDKPKDLSFIFQDMENKLKESLGTKVSIISKGSGSGKIEIEFFSNEEMDRIYELLVK